VLLIITDDVGFGAPSTFGGLVPTPNLDRIANAGLRFTQFHSTALCSPTRAALIAGRNHHSVGFGVITEISTGYPGYNSVITKDTATIGTILRDNGYATSWFGKNHNTPSFQASQAGPFDQWPIGMGFDYFYGFIMRKTWKTFISHWHSPVRITGPTLTLAAGIRLRATSRSGSTSADGPASWRNRRRCLPLCIDGFGRAMFSSNQRLAATPSK
jgi:arylsulfatase A-like enzyme